MPFLLGRHDSLLVLYFLCYFILPILSQTIQNPAFGQELNTFSGPSGNTRSVSNINVAQSQAFQTVYLFNNTDYTMKPLFDFKDGCNESTTLDDLQRWNGNGVNTLSGIQARAKIALVQRGGNCKWSDKVRTVTRLSTTLQLGIQVMLIYDNQTLTASSPPLQGYTVSPATGTTNVPAYPNSQLPTIFNISQMTDNDITSQPVLLNQPNEIYFVSNDYGLDLLDALRTCFNTTTPNTKNAPSVYVFLVPLLRSFPWAASIGGTSNPNYLSWVIALASLFFIAVLGLLIFFRWWRIRQQREERAYNAMLEERNAIAMRRRKLKPLPVDIVNSYPIQNYHVDDIKNTSCAICLDDFEENQSDIRVLPCGHGFCVLCIDPWLTQKSTHCPICKYNCLPVELRDPEDDDEEANVDGVDITNNQVTSHGSDPNGQDDNAIPCEASSLTTTPSAIQITTTTPPPIVTDNQDQKSINEKETHDGSSDEPQGRKEEVPSSSQDPHNNNDPDKETDGKKT